MKPDETLLITALWWCQEEMAKISLPSKKSHQKCTKTQIHLHRHTMQLYINTQIPAHTIRACTHMSNTNTHIIIEMCIAYVLYIQAYIHTYTNSTTSTRKGILCESLKIENVWFQNSGLPRFYEFEFFMCVYAKSDVKMWRSKERSMMECRALSLVSVSYLTTKPCGRHELHFLSFTQISGRKSFETNSLPRFY